MYKPKECPKCKSDNILKIEYGLPDNTLINDPKIYLGGCCITGEDPLWHCAKCHWQWGGKSEGAYCTDDVE